MTTTLQLFRLINATSNHNKTLPSTTHPQQPPVITGDHLTLFITLYLAAMVGCSIFVGCLKMILDRLEAKNSDRNSDTSTKRKKGFLLPRWPGTRSHYGMTTPSDSASSTSQLNLRNP